MQHSSLGPTAPSSMPPGPRGPRRAGTPPAVASAFALALSLGACATTSSPGQATRNPTAETASSAPVGAEQAALPAHVADFDYTWERIRETHWDSELVGAPWDAARAELRPRVVAAQTPDEARAVIRDLLSRLGQSHFGLIARRPDTSSQDSSDTADATAPGGPPGSIGLGFRVFDGEAVVTRVVAGGPADKAGVKPGWAIRRVDEHSFAPQTTAPDSTDSSSSANDEADEDHRHDNQLLGDVYRALAGPAGNPVELELAAEGKVETFSLERTPATLTSFGNLKNIPVEYEAKRLDTGIGYVRLSAFFDPTVFPRLREDIQRFRDAPGIVLDLRGNGGGIGAMAMGLGGLFVSGKGHHLGTMVDKTRRLKFVLNPQPGAYTGKLAILVDGGCGSTCEILAGGLAEIGRATVVGTATAGAVLPSQIETLPSGDLLQFAVANFISTSGSTLEGSGVEPAVVAELDRESLLRGVDSQLAAAVQWIQRN